VGQSFDPETGASPAESTVPAGLDEQPLATLGLLSDTHIPDRARELHPEVLPALRRAGVDRILHAGDICSPAVLRELEQIAPVTAVRGNRDWLLRGQLGWTELIEVGGVPIALQHGHGSWWDYLWDKWQHIVFGYRLESYLKVLVRPHPEARVIVFGHTHRATNLQLDGRLLFNPGSAGVDLPEAEPSIGVLRIYPGQKVVGEIIPLRGARLRRGRWQQTSFPNKDRNS